jgi:hypothetical protein
MRFNPMRPVIIGLVLSFVFGSCHLYSQAVATCGTQGDLMGGLNSKYPRSARELKNLKTAPHRAYRHGEHTLVIQWQHGRQLFRDEPPYEAGLDGLHWSYCGFNPSVGMHLIGKQDGDLFTGELLKDSSGAILQAGELVVFSPSAKHYLAYEKPNGQDGSTIKLYNANGRLLWQGIDGMPSANGRNSLAEFEKVSWTGADELMAEYSDSGKHHMLVLVSDTDGSWHWREL